MRSLNRARRKKYEKVCGDGPSSLHTVIGVCALERIKRGGSSFFFLAHVHIVLPVIAEKPLAACGYRKFQIDP